MMLALLPLFGFSACAGVSALLVGVIYRGEQLEDGRLLRQFLIFLAIAVGLLLTTVQRPSVQQRLRPELKLQADIEADPIYKALAHFGPEYTAKFQALLAAENVTSATLPDARLQARSMLTALANNRLGFVKQATQIAWGQATVDTLKELNADKCYTVISGRPLDRDTLAHGFSAENAAEFEAAALNVVLQSPGIQTSRKGPGDYQNDDKAADFNATMLEYSRIQDEVAGRYGKEVADLLTSKRFPQDAPFSSGTICSARIFQLETMLERPKATAALLIDSALR